LRARQAGLLVTLLPKLTLIPQQGLDPRAYFTRPSRPLLEAAMTTEAKDVWLEIGFGAGEHLVWQAENNPSVGLIGAEPYISGQAKLLAKIADKNLSNIRLYPEDARDVIAALPDSSLSRVFILFPDPWPKTRHHKRRFIQMEMLNELARVMKPGAELRFATDDRDYLVWTLECFMAHPNFCWAAAHAQDWRERASDWPQTRYEMKALHGKPAYLRFVRRER
jgi:tRNA (guanine-N7-)-methyltransferase